MNSNKKKNISSTDIRINYRLSLRKNELQHNLRRLKNSTTNNKNKYEFSDEDFINYGINSETSEKNETIFDISIEDLVASCETENKIELKFWLYKLGKISLEGNKELIQSKIINKISVEKINLLFKLIIFSDNNVGTVSDDILKIRYQSICILINILVDTDTYNQIFIDKAEMIINFMLNLLHKVSQINENVLLYHLQWLFSNMIESEEMFYCINQNKKLNIIDFLKQVFDYNSKKENYLDNIVTLWILQFCLHHLDGDSIAFYSIFINNIQNLVQKSMKHLNVELLVECFNCLIEYSKSAQCLNIILNPNNNNEINLLQSILKTVNIVPEAHELINIMIVNDKSNFILSSYDIFGEITLPFLFGIKDGDDKKTTTNTVNSLNLFHTLLDKPCVSADIINKFMSNSKCFDNFIYLYTNNDSFEIKKKVIVILTDIFQKGDIRIKQHLCNIKLHIFLINEIQKYIDEAYGKDLNEIIALLLSGLEKILIYSDQNYSKINYVQKELEESNIIGLLLKLQCHKQQSIYETAVSLLESFWGSDYI